MPVARISLAEGSSRALWFNTGNGPASGDSEHAQTCTHKRQAALLLWGLKHGADGGKPCSRKGCPFGALLVLRAYTLPALPALPAAAPPAVIVVNDTQKDPRFKASQFVPWPPLTRFYAAAPVVSLARPPSSWGTPALGRP